MIPCYSFWVNKSALQVGLPLPTFTWKDSLCRGLKEGFPAITIIVGCQLYIQREIEKRLPINRKVSPFLFTGASSFLTGVVTSPILAYYNLLTMKKPSDTFSQIAKLALKRLSWAQVGALAARETTCLYSMRILGPLESLFGDSLTVKCSSAFISGCVGSLSGHPLDTAFTLWQKQFSITSLTNVNKNDTALQKATKYSRVLMRGGYQRALGMGISVCIYDLANWALGVKPESGSFN